MAKPLVAIGILGSTLDTGGKEGRWLRWRPTVSLCQQQDLLISRFELLYTRKYQKLLNEIVADIRTVSPETLVNPVVYETPDAWDFESVYATLHDFAKAYPFKPDQEDYVVHITTGTHVAQICWYLLTESRHIPGKLIQTGPSLHDKDNNKTNPSGIVKIIDLNLSRYDKIAARFAKERRGAVQGLKSGIATRNTAFNQLIEELEHVAAATKDPILLIGPTGAGKSSLARRLFELKKQRYELSGSFVEVNCATLRGDTAMSALFGHKKGSYTGAGSDRNGLLRAADGGALFLDEIGELKLDEQAMLLRALEEKKFLPVGADVEVESNFMLVAGTNRDLRAAVSRGLFRDDLLARINLWTFHLPALRDRPEDIEPNLDYELERFAQRNNRVVRMNTQAREHYVTFAQSPASVWPGNFRDLSASVTRMATLAHGSNITVEDVNREVSRLVALWASESPSVQTPEAKSILPAADVLIVDRYLPAGVEIDPFDRVQLAYVLTVCERHTSLSRAGREIYAVSRGQRASTNDTDRVRKYLAKFGIDWNARSVQR